MSKEVKKLNKESEINETFSYGIIYVYSIPDEQHKGRLKIGSATTNSTNPTQKEIDLASNNRIKQQTKTADISYNLEYSELAITDDNKYFSDHDVHEVLKRSGYKRKSENIKNVHSEWFEVSLELAKKAIQAVKEGRKSLTTEERTTPKISQFPFRPNQLEAISRTTRAIRKNRKHFLWNAKMRFGKTSAAMQVAKENNMQKVLIVTHRPSVSVDWKNDFDQVLASANYEYSSKTEGEDIKILVKSRKSFVYFASLQDLRLSKRVVEDGSAGSQARGFDKNEEVFDTTWDMLIVDEAHEGTQSDLGDATFLKIPTNFTLQLSGTPFNILHKHEEDDIYTWDYVMEQEEKLSWDEKNPGIPNPYAELPALSIFTYDVDTFASHIGSIGENFHDALDGAFKFHEFFRVHKDDEGKDTALFVHEPMVKKFLDLLVNSTLQTKFPYATEEYRNYNKHSLWLLPNRTEVIKAMEKLLKNHDVFGKFGIVNISGNSFDEDEDSDAKNRVSKAIKEHDYTITLTGQRLTTGASIKEWTAVFMMSDTNSATTYLQTAFRCQTPAKIDGKLKTQGYVFDFAPDRTLKLIAEAIELNHKSGKTNSPEQKEAMAKFLNFCPILAAKGGAMKPYDVGEMLGQLKKAIIERVSRNGFDDPKLYNDELLKLDELDIAKFNELKNIVGKSTGEKINEIKINELGMDELKIKKAEEAESKKKQVLSEEQKEALKKIKEAREQKKTAISILRAVSIRMPMLVYGANVSIREDITLQKFIDLVDEESWQEFMPAGLTKEGFREFTKYYDEDVFKGVAHSIRAKAFDCDDLLPTERIQAVAEIFKTFKNPDKETVLTPWNVVNKHMTIAFGGHDFISEEKDKIGKPVWRSHNVDTSIWLQDDTKVLEINSKSGLYPLLAAYNVYSRQLIKSKKPEEKVSQKIWSDVLKNNIYVLCKSPMAQSITFRTLAGYNKSYKTNIIHIKDLIKKLQQKENYKEYNLKVELLEKFNLNDKNMKFTAVVGNPPYQVTTDTNFATPVYHLFFEAAKSLDPDYLCLIHPARFLFNAGATPKEWNKQMLNDQHLSVPLYEPNSQKIFSGVDIKGGVCITLWNKNKSSGGLGGKFVAHIELEKILTKVKAGGFDVIVSTAGGSPTIRYEDKFGRKRSYFRTSAFFDMPDFFSENKDSKHTIKIVGLQKGNKRTERYVCANILNDKNIDKYKVLLPESNGGSSFGILGKPLIAEPFTGSTESFIQIGSFKLKNEAENCMKYIQTRFCRVLLGTLKVTQHNPKSTWKNVPLQDFTNKSDIDWSKSIPEIDKQLYAKYGLDKKEIDFIETNVKSMT
ncbi:MAG TPA: Eco57I restriction-modification methylase domain-containing protein [Saprospiraceae bacterium]|nr:Eco57I restriction-modification methylase domain-containing protein [Saprospiraceae bacterium]